MKTRSTSRSPALLALAAVMSLAAGLVPAGAVPGQEASLDAKGDAEAQAEVLNHEPILSMPTEPIGFRPCVDGMAGPFPCHNVDLLTFWPPSAFGGGPSSAYGGPGNDSWGWTDPETGTEWVLMGRANGTSFIDIGDPKNPVLVATLARHQTNALWSDIKTYKDHAFIVSEGAGNGMQVFDLTRLRTINPSGGPVAVSADAHYAGFGNSHNIVINEDSGFAYPVGTGGAGNPCSSSLHMVDIRDPLNPTYAGCYNQDGYTHDAQCVTYRGPDERYQGRELCFLANPSPTNQGRVTVVDVTDKANPVLVSRTLQLPPYAYSHQGWLTQDHRYFLHNDESDNMNNRAPGRTRTRVFDVQDLENVTVQAVHHSATRASAHNLYTDDRYVYLTNYFDGLRVADISQIDEPGDSFAPETPSIPDHEGTREVACFDTDPARNDHPGFGGSWSNYPYFEDGVVVVSGFDGMFLLQVNVDEDSTGGGADGCIVNGKWGRPTLDPEFELDGDTATVSGTVDFPAITEPESVGGTKTSFSAQAAPAGAAAGLDLVAGKILPISGGLRFIWEVTDLPEEVLPEGARYAWNLRVGGASGTHYQLEAKRTGLVSVNTLEAPLHHLQRGAQESFRLRGNCGAYEGTAVQDCHHLAYLEGRFDPAENQVSVDLPYQAKDHLGRVVAPDLTANASLHPVNFQGMSISASFNAGTTTNNTSVSNWINGWSAFFPVPQVALTVAPDWERPTRLAFGPGVLPVDGAFTAEAAGVSETDNTVFVRACARSACGYTSLRVG